MIDPMPFCKPLNQPSQARELLLVLHRALGSEIPEVLCPVAQEDGVRVIRRCSEVVLKVARPMMELGLGLSRESIAAAFVDAIPPVGVLPL